MQTTAPKVYQAIARVMSDIGKAGIAKNRNNAQQGYNFRGIDDCFNALSPFLASAGLCVLPRVIKREVTERASRSGGVLFSVVLDMEYDLVCAEDGSKHTVGVVGEAMDSGDKATNKAMSAAYKYATMQTFCIPTEGEPDADATTHEVALPDIHQDVWAELKDAAKIGTPDLRKAWAKLTEETRDDIAMHFADKWAAIKAVAEESDEEAFAKKSA